MTHPISVIHIWRSLSFISRHKVKSDVVFPRIPIWFWTTPFGFPVVPDVKATKSGSVGVMGIACRIGDAFSISVFQSLTRGWSGRPSSSRTRQRTVETASEDATASNKAGIILTLRPARVVDVAVTTAFTSASFRRKAMAGAAKPEKSGMAIAPRRAIAIKAAAISGIMGI